ncbi:MAG: hypothetical protein V4616_14545 [Bacteroidota bacterium]
MINNKVLLATAITAVLAGCSGLGKMQKCIDEVKKEATPNPLEVKGEKVAVNIYTQFPTRYFDRRSRLEFTPTLVYKNGETAYKPYGLQGEKFPGNDKMIAYKNGGEHTYTGEVTYNPAMEVSELQLNITGYRGKRTKKFTPIKLADGVITTPFLLQIDDRPILGADQYKRVTQHTQRVVINYLVNSSDVLAKEKADADVKEAQAFLKMASKDKAYSIDNVTIEAFASPEGELRRNENLAKDRAASAKVVIADLFAGAKMKQSVLTTTPKGEDWEGFKELMEKSKIADKELILRLLNMYTDPQKREEEIRNLSATFTEVSEQILPKLRRAAIDINYHIQGRTDEEILSLAKSNPSKLTAEELLYAATLTQNTDEKMTFYTSAEKQFPNDYRGSNNIGYLLYQKGDIAGAKAKFEKANKIEENLATGNNLGILARRDGNRAVAMKMFNNASSLGNDAKYNAGLVNIQNGDYNAAILNMKDYNTYNTALVYTLTQQYDKAEKALKASPDRETAQGYYLGAIIGARSNRTEVVVENLTLAVKADASLKDKASRDPEFIRYRDNAAFKALIK